MLEDLLNKYFITEDYISEYIEKSKDYRELNEIEYKLHNKLEKVLKGGQAELFEKYSDTVSEIGYELRLAFFKAGMKAGFRLTAELFAE